MDHLQRVRHEFTRQASQFATAAAVTREDLVRRFGDAVLAGPDPSVLDVACGPGVIAATLAPARRHR